MFIEAFRDRLLVDSCCSRPASGLIEISNSVREKELRKIWVDCSTADDALLIKLEEKKKASCAHYSAGQACISKPATGLFCWPRMAISMRYFVS